jgi:branched-chain amino acid transport system ATP-binding protein
MLAVTRALMGRPRVLLLDELATGLAPKIVQMLATTVQDLAAGGMAILLAAPELTVLGHAVDRGYVLVRGSVTATVENGFGPLQARYEQALGIQRSGSAAEPARLEQGLPG